MVIDAEGPMSQRALGRRLRIDKSPMVGVLDDLERLGLAERRRRPSDRRIQAIHLTPKGRRVLAGGVPLADAENQRTFAGLDDNERAQLQALLLRVAEATPSRAPECRRPAASGVGVGVGGGVGVGRRRRGRRRRGGGLRRRDGECRSAS